MFIVKAAGAFDASSVLRWLRGEEGLQVFGTRAAAQKIADRLSLAPGGEWVVVELPALLVSARDEIADHLRLVESVLAQMREAGAVAMWPRTEDENDAPVTGAVKLPN